MVPALARRGPTGNRAQARNIGERGVLVGQLALPRSESRCSQPREGVGAELGFQTVEVVLPGFFYFRWHRVRHVPQTRQRARTVRNDLVALKLARRRCVSSAIRRSTPRETPPTTGAGGVRRTDSLVFGGSRGTRRVLRAVAPCRRRQPSS